MNAIMNNAMSAYSFDFNYQQSSCFFQQEDNGSFVLHKRQACSVALKG